MVTQGQSLLQESRELEAHELPIEHVDSDEGGLEMDPEIPLYSMTTTPRNREQARTTIDGKYGREPEDELGMEELLAQDELVVQDAQHPAQEPFQAEQPKQEAREQRSLSRCKASLRLSPLYVMETMGRWCESINFSLFREYSSCYGFAICG